MIKNSEQVVTMVLNSFHDPHPRVRWAAITAIARLSVDLGSHLQVKYHTRVLPALASAMDDFENPRVQVVGFWVHLLYVKSKLDLYIAQVTEIEIWALIVLDFKEVELAKA